jgi:Secretion system C-terminal sorting domain
MKKIIMLYLLGLGLNLTSQTTDFAPNGAKWVYCQLNPVLPNYQIPFNVEVTFDTTVNNINCRKIFGLGGCGFSDISYLYNVSDSVLLWSKFTNKFELLYNFKANAGESWTVFSEQNFPPNFKSLKVNVDSVSYITIGGIYRKVQHVSFEPENFWTWGNQIIAGLGNNEVFSPIYGICEFMPCGIRCYEDTDIEIHFVNYPCDTSGVIVSYDEIKYLRKFEIYPNPASSRLSLIMQTTNLTFCHITDIVGKTMLQVNIPKSSHTNQYDIDISILPIGIYLLSVRDKQGLIGVKKLVIYM